MITNLHYAKKKKWHIGDKLGKLTELKNTELNLWKSINEYSKRRSQQWQFVKLFSREMALR